MIDPELRNRACTVTRELVLLRSRWEGSTEVGELLEELEQIIVDMAAVIDTQDRVVAMTVAQITKMAGERTSARKE